MGKMLAVLLVRSLADWWVTRKVEMKAARKAVLTAGNSAHWSAGNWAARMVVHLVVERAARWAASMVESSAQKSEHLPVGMRAVPTAEQRAGESGEQTVYL